MRNSPVATVYHRQGFPGAMGFLLTGALIWSSGCAVTRGNIGDRVNPDAVAALQKGVTTRQEALHALGAPDRILQINGREVFQYYHYDIKSSSLVLILLNLSRTQVKSDDLYLFFAKDGPLDEVMFGRRTESMAFRFWPFGD